MGWGTFAGGLAQGAQSGFNTVSRAMVAKEQMEMAKAEEARKAADAAYSAETRNQMDAYVKQWQGKLTEQVPGDVGPAGEQAMVTKPRQATPDEQMQFATGLGQIMATRQKMSPAEFAKLRETVSKYDDERARSIYMRIGAGEDPPTVLADAPESIKNAIKPGSVVVKEVPFQFSASLPPMTDRVITYQDHNGKTHEISTLKYAMARSSFEKLAEIHGKATVQGAQADAAAALARNRDAKTATEDELRAPKVDLSRLRGEESGSRIKLNAMRVDNIAADTNLKNQKAVDTESQTRDRETTRPSRIERNLRAPAGRDGGGASSGGRVVKTTVDDQGFHVYHFSDGRPAQRALDADGKPIKADRLGEARLAASLARIRQQGDLTGRVPVERHIEAGKKDAESLTGRKATPKEGTLARNPKTGEEIEFRDGKWVPRKAQ